MELKRYILLENNTIQDLKIKNILANGSLLALEDLKKGYGHFLKAGDIYYGELTEKGKITKTSDNILDLIRDGN